MIGLSLLCACGAAFSPPARSDLDFAAYRPTVGAREASVRVNDGQGTTGQLGVRGTISSNDTIEITTLHAKTPGANQGFHILGLGYRRHLTDVSAPLQASVGMGIGGGIGGASTDWPKDVSHFPVAAVGWIDAGLGWHISQALTVYGAGRGQRSGIVGGDFSKNNTPLTTGWWQLGVGARLDVKPLWLAIESSSVYYANKSEDRDFRLTSMVLGMRWGSSR